MKPIAVVATVLLMLPSTAVAQLCLGRSLPGEAGAAAEVALLGDGYATRFAAGHQQAGGLGWRLGVIGAADESDPWSLALAQAELSYTLPTFEGVAMCPGLSVVRTLPSLDAETLVEGLVSLSAHRAVGPGTVVGFATPRVYYRSGVSGSDPGLEREPELGGGLTVGIGALVGPVSARVMLNLIAARYTGVYPVLGFGVGVRGPLPGRSGVDGRR